MTVDTIAIKKNRLINTIHETSDAFGPKYSWGPRSTDTGVCRLALSDDDKGVRDWFVKETSDLGCEVKIDELGNIFAIYPGKNEGYPTAIGSHLDTQPTGGRYDGIYGVLSGLELLRTLKDNNITPNYPICVVDWMNEEGARFPMSMMASSVYGGKYPKEKIYDIKSVTDKVPVTVKDELERIGYLGNIPCSYEANPIAAHFEIHIEQGPILENENKKIGIVQGVQAFKWIKVNIKGKAQHTGTTPLGMRSDPLLAASEIVTKGNRIAQELKGLFSVGIMNLKPAVVNVIPNEVEFIVDIRHNLDESLRQMFDSFLEEVEVTIKEGGPKLSSTHEILFDLPAVHFNKTCIKCVEDSAKELFGADNTREIVSGAGHDSCPVSSVCPTTMIFIPSKDGVSHNPEEYSTPEQVEEGFKVLLNAVLKYDELRNK